MKIKIEKIHGNIRCDICGVKKVQWLIEIYFTCSDEFFPIMEQFIYYCSGCHTMIDDIFHKDGVELFERQTE